MNITEFKNQERFRMVLMQKYKNNATIKHEKKNKYLLSLKQ